MKIKLLTEEQLEKGFRGTRLYAVFCIIGFVLSAAFINVSARDITIMWLIPVYFLVMYVAVITRRGQYMIMLMIKNNTFPK